MKIRFTLATASAEGAAFQAGSKHSPPCQGSFALASSPCSEDMEPLTVPTSEGLLLSVTQVRAAALPSLLGQHRGFRGLAALGIWGGSLQEGIPSPGASPDSEISSQNGDSNS